MYATARVPTAINDSFERFRTFTIISTLLEYLNALKTRNTLNAFIILKILRTLNPLFITVNDGRIEIKSIIAIKENGYLINELADFLLYL